MILYFSGTGNSLAVARQLAERLNERLMPLIEAVKQDLTNEKRIGLVFPTYDFNLPPAMRNMVAQLNINPQSYVFTVVTCGSMAGNCIWVLRRILREKGIQLAYSHKVSVPDNSALAFGRNPNKQLGKFSRVPARMEQIVRELQAEKHELHYSWFSLLSWHLGRPAVERYDLMLRSQSECRQVYRLWHLRTCLPDEQYKSNIQQRQRSNRQSRSSRPLRRPLYRVLCLRSRLCTAGNHYEWATGSQRTPISSSANQPERLAASIRTQRVVPAY